MKPKNSVAGGSVFENTSESVQSTVARPAMSAISATILERAPKILLYASVFLIPLWFLPITQEILNFQKQALLLILVLAAVIVSLANIVQKGELRVRFSWLDISVSALLVIVIVSTVTSVWRYGSLWGWPLSPTDNLLTIAAFVLFYFLVANTVKDANEFSQLFLAFIISSGIACLYAMLQLYHVFVIPFQFAKASTFNTIGSVNSIAMLSAIVLPMSLTMSLITKTRIKWVLYVATVLLLLTMLVTNFFSAWIVLAVELVLLLTFWMWKFKKTTEFKWMSLPMVLLVVSLFFLVFRVALPGTPQLPLEVSPSVGAEMTMLRDSIKQNPLGSAFGSGPGTFVFDYTKYHSVTLNQTIFWGTRFTSGISEILDSFFTKGILGGLALIVVMGLAIFLAVKALLKSNSDSTSWMLSLAILTGFSGMVVSQILYYSNFTLFFLFWFLLAGVELLLLKKEKIISLAPPSILAIASSFVFLMVLILSVGFLFIASQKYVAEVQYLQGAQAVARGDVNGGINKILSAVSLNPSQDAYLRDLSQLYLSQLSQIQTDKTLTDDQKKQQSQTAISNAVVAANQTVIVDPANVENWNVKGFIYRNLIGFQGADTMAIESYNKARTIEPSSPFGYTELGRVYLAQAQNLASQKDTTGAQDALNKSLDNLNKAIALKSDYAPADYLIALVYDQQGKSDQAIAQLEQTAKVAPSDIGLAFQLGVMYYQKGQFVNAQGHLERAKALNPDYANARYMLGLVYDKQGKTSLAIAEFKKVLDLNPDNTQVKQILANLNAGKPALTGLQQGTPPIAENPPEIGAKPKTGQ